MKPQDQHPNPVEDYMREIMAGDTLGESGSVVVPATGASVTEEPQPAVSPQTKQADELPVFDPKGRMEQIRPNETKVVDIRRHPIGLTFLYVQFIVAMGLSIGLLILLLPGVLGSTPAVKMFLGLLVLVVTILGFIFVILATKVYRGNRLIVTDVNVTEVQQLGLFNKKISELTMANIEDVTANTNGVMQTMFGYGTLTVETAGANENFIFKYCPNPNACAKVIEDTRQVYINSHSRE